MTIRYLLDENLWPQLKAAVQNLDPVIDVLRVGDPGAPAFGTSDPEILRYVEETRRLLVTANRRSMPVHLEAHWAAGGHVWGICWVRPEASVGQLAEDLYLIWIASDADEWLDRLEWIPFSPKRASTLVIKSQGVTRWKNRKSLSPSQRIYTWRFGNNRATTWQRLCVRRW